MSFRESPGVTIAELPVHLTRFIGRDRELEELVRLISTTRLLTLTGAGGSGKTRLAGEVALRVAADFQRVVWVDLAPLADAALLPAHAAAAVHATERVDSSPLQRITGALGDARTLLVLDNCEHLVEACAELGEALLRNCPRLVVLATSREALGVPSETAWLVPPLASREAVELFAERAQATMPSFALSPANADVVGEICRRLDGIPLAIELAAARVRVLAPEQIARRLDDAFRLLTTGSRTALPRHRTLRATMEWSFDLLGEREQVLLARLAVFAGGFSLDAAEAVCTGGILSTDDILDGVSALVDRSLVEMTAGETLARYRLLETVRQYGWERLTIAGERELLERRHGEYFLSMLEAADPLLFGGERERGLLVRLAADNDNFRAAAAWSVRDDARAPIALRFAAAFFWYWYGSAMHMGAGQFGEGRRFVTEALAQGAACDPGLRGRALTTRGLIGLAQGDYEDASAAFDEALSLLRATGDAPGVTFVLSKYGATRLMVGDLDRAWEMLEEAHGHVEHVRPETMLHSFVYSWRGAIARVRGDLAAARTMHEANLRVGRAMSHRTSLGHGHAFMAAVDLAEGRTEAAFAHYCEALPYHLDLGDGWGLALDIEGLSALAGLRGRHADAVRLIGAVDALRERSAVALPASDAADRAKRATRLRDRLGDAFDGLYAEGRALTVEEIVRLATDDTVVHTAEHRVPSTDMAAAADAPVVCCANRSLCVRALGPLEVIVDGRAVDASAWGSARPRELLVYLLVHPEGRTKEQAGLAFWPEASAAQLRNNFHVTLHRLRRVLGGADRVVLVGDRYRIDPAALDQFDVVEFERAVVAARQGLRRRDADAAAMLERALATYRGDFLDGEPAGDWHLEHRDRLQRLVVDASMELGALLLAEERHARAADVYRRVLVRDELHEEALLALMRCHAALGERSQAMRAYVRYAERLRAELDAEPGEEAARYFEVLQQGAVGV